MLDEPLKFHVEKLVEQYGYIEIIQSLIELMDADSQYAILVPQLEKIRNAAGNINRSKNLEAVDPEQVDRPTNENPNREDSISFLNMFYQGDIPKAIVKINKL